MDVARIDDKLTHEFEGKAMSAMSHHPAAWKRPRHGCGSARA